MGESTKIEWTHHTFNPWRGCTKVSDGCKHCYAETMSHRNPAVLGEWGPKGKRVIAAEAYWKQPLRWNKQAAEAGERRRVFCLSLGDVFEDRPELIEPRARLFTMILQAPHLDWLLLTKRPENWRSVVEAASDYLFDHGDRNVCGRLVDWWKHGIALPNVWIGTSVENQATANERIPELLAIPATVRFLSCEPLLGPVDLDQWTVLPVGSSGGEHHMPWLRQPDDPEDGPPSGGIDWVIVGGESGPNARPMHPDWARSLRDQCNAAGVPFFFKQWGEWVMPAAESFWRDPDCNAPMMWMWPDGRVQEFTPIDDGKVGTIKRVGKKRAGRLLDGREWNGRCGRRG